MTTLNSNETPAHRELLATLYSRQALMREMKLYLMNAFRPMPESAKEALLDNRESEDLMVAKILEL